LLEKQNQEKKKKKKPRKMQPISSSTPAKPNRKTQTQPQNQILMPKKLILIPQNSFFDSKLKPKGKKLTIWDCITLKVGKMWRGAGEAPEKMTQSRDPPGPHPSHFLPRLCLSLEAKRNWKKRRK
jgi:hypothetical protein